MAVSKEAAIFYQQQHTGWRILVAWFGAGCLSRSLNIVIWNLVGHLVFVFWDLPPKTAVAEYCPDS
jgi:hypothetical protein